jgi:glycerophosphoryl diester phosphodiesterase
MWRWLAMMLAACSGSSAAQPTSDAAVEEDTAVKPPIDPARFDCTATKTPPRVSPTPEPCLRDPKCTTRMVSGHRGAGGDLGRIAPEDTLAAYRAAIVMGVDLVETDPRPTSDGVIVNVHDTTLERTTSGTGRVDAQTYDSISKLSIKTNGLAGDYSCERVPTLRQILELCRGRALVLVDANKTDRVDLLVQAIKDANALEWAVFDTSQLEKIDAALMLEPKLMIMPRVHALADADTIVMKYASHLPVFVEISATIFPKTVDKVRALGTRVLTDVFTTDISVKLGSPPSKYLDLYGQGADVLQTDLPDLVLTALGRTP